MLTKGFAVRGGVMGQILRLILLLILSGMLAVQTSVAAPNLEEQFQPQDFTPEEVRIIQRSLTFLGYYDGLWDKQWGPASQSALEAYSEDSFDQPMAPNAAVVAAILEAFDVVDELGWVDIPVEAAGISFGVPEKHVRFNENADSVEFIGPELTIRLWTSGMFTARQFHRRVAQQGTSRQAYSVRRETRLVSSVQRGSEIVYARSDRVGANWVTLEIESAESASDLVAFVSSSFDTSGDFSVRDGDLVNIVGLFEELEALGDGADSSPPGPGAGAVPHSASGTGFFVSSTQLVTNAHVIEGCSVLYTPDGTELEVVAQDTGEDLALLSYAGISDAVLPIVPNGDAVLGQEVAALGYPLYGMLSRQLNFTSGVVSATAGLGDDQDHFTLTAPIQPGNSGGPILNDISQVVGVAVATVDAARLAAEQGFVPQNINAAIKSSTLRAFLRANKVDFQTQGIKPTATGGVPPGVQRAVVPVICEGGSGVPASASEGPQRAELPEGAGSSSNPINWYMAEFDGLDFYGGDIEPGGLSTSSLRQCQQQCADDPDCRLYTYNARHNVCFIKEDYVLAQSHPDAQSGLIFPAESPDAAPRFPVKWQLHQGSTYSGESFRSLTTGDYQSCIAECEGDASCRAFTYAPNVGVRQCQMFSNGHGRLLDAAGPATISGEAVDSVVEPDAVTFLAAD